MFGGVVYALYDGWTADERDGLDICEKEFHASNVALEVLGVTTGDKYFYEFTDNSVVLAVMRSMTPGTLRLQVLMERRIELLSRKGWRSLPERISSINNLWADMLSRGEWMDVQRQAEALGYKFVVLPIPEVCRASRDVLSAGEDM